MNIRDFIDKDSFYGIQENITKREKFDYGHEYKGKNGKIVVQIRSCFIDEILAKSTWNGKDYLVHFDEYHQGAKIGYGGHGFAVAEFPMFECWDKFKVWFDKEMRNYDEYEADEYGQVSLF